MNANLLAILKQIVADYGEGVLAEPHRVSAFFADLAKDEPKPQKNAFVKCLEHGFAQTLKNAPEQDRDTCKQKLAQRLHDEEGLDRELCGESVELLAVVLFGEEQKKNDNLCKNCGQELQEGWKICPYCTAQVEAEETAPEPKAKKPAKKKSQVISSEISSGSGSAGYGINLITHDDSQISSGSGSWEYGIEQIKPEVVEEPATTEQPTVAENSKGGWLPTFLIILKIILFLALSGTLLVVLVDISPVLSIIVFVLICILPALFIKKKNAKNKP